MSTKQTKVITDREDIKSGYVVKLRNGEYRLVVRAGRFTKILVNSTNWNYLTSWDSQKFTYFGSSNRGNYTPPDPREFDIMEIYGLIDSPDQYLLSINVTITGRTLLWKREPSVQLTLRQVCDRLGYDVELIPEGRSDCND